MPRSSCGFAAMFHYEIYPAPFGEYSFSKSHTQLELERHMMS